MAGFAVGTTIADRPPHRSVRAELPHTAPTSDEWRQGATWRTPLDPWTLVPRSVSGSCRVPRRSPWSAPFPPQPPPRRWPLCSAASLVLWRSQTPPWRTRPACGYSPSRTGLLAQTPRRSPGSRAYCFSACLGSSTTPGPAMARDLSPSAGMAFPLTEKGRRPVLSFRSSIAQPTDASVYASPAASRRPAQDSRSGWSRFSFPVGLFHPLQHAGLSRRTLSPGTPPDDVADADQRRRKARCGPVDAAGVDHVANGLLVDVEVVYHRPGKCQKALGVIAEDLQALVRRENLQQAGECHGAEDKFGRVATLLAGFYHLGAGHALRERQVGFHAQRPAQHDDEGDANQPAHQQDQHGLPVVLAQVRPQVLAVDFDHHEGRYGEDRPGDQRFPHRSGRAGDVLLQDAPAHHAEHGDGDHGRRDGNGDSLPQIGR